MQPWSDTITVLRARGGKRMTKVIQSDGTFIDYDKAFLYDAAVHPLAGLDDFRTLLNALLHKSDHCVVRGGLLNHLEGATNIRRLVNRDPKTGDEPTLEDRPRRWLGLDADGIERPGNVHATDLLACADVVIEQLPRPFWRAASIIQASAGHGIKPGIRMRLWYWCDRPMTGGELKRWLASAPLDHSVFNAAQPIYTSAPLMGPGVHDHLPFRLIDMPGEQWLAVPTAEELLPPPRPSPEAVRPACVSGSARARLYTDAALRKAQARISTAGQRHPAILSEACSLARFVQAGLLSQTELHNTLWSAAQTAGKDDEAEIGRMVAFGMEHPDSNPLPVEFRHG